MVAATHLCKHKHISLTLEASLELEDGKEELASQKILVELNPLATEANMNLVADIMEHTPEVYMDMTPKGNADASAKLEPVGKKEKSLAESKEEHLALESDLRVVDTEIASQITVETSNPPANKENLKFEEHTKAPNSILAIMALTPEPLAEEPTKLNPVTFEETLEPIKNLGASTSSFGSYQSAQDFSPRSSTSTQCTEFDTEGNSKEDEQMRDAPPTEKEDEQMSEVPATVPVQENAAAASELDASQIVEEKMEDAPVSVPEADLKDDSQVPVDNPLLEVSPIPNASQTYASPGLAAEVSAVEESNDSKVKEAPPADPSQTQQASPAAECSFSHIQEQHVVDSQAPVQNEFSASVSQPPALPIMHDDRKSPLNPPAAPLAVSTTATHMIVSQCPPISPEQLMSQIIKLVELNNKRQDQQTSVNTYTINGN